MQSTDTAVEIKIDLHTHTADDPQDQIPHTTEQLIDRAAELGYGALAITLHDKQLAIEPLVAYAAERAIVLVPGVERTIEGKHVLLLNFERGTEDVRSFDDLAALKHRDARGLVIAPHPFFPGSTCLGGVLDERPELFDAVECNGMFTAQLNFNRAAERWALHHRKPVVGNGDVHRLVQLGTTYSIVRSEPTADGICRAVADGHVRVEARPHSILTAARLVAALFLGPSKHAAPSSSAAHQSEVPASERSIRRA
jgi:predicted metal-dependent phosphoesterase TrpH